MENKELVDIIDNYLVELKLDYYKTMKDFSYNLNNSFKYFNKLVNLLIQIYKERNIDIPGNKVIFCIRLLGQENVNEKTLFLLQGLIYESNYILKIIYDNPKLEVIKLVETIKKIIIKEDLKKEKSKKYIKQ